MDGVHDMGGMQGFGAVVGFPSVEQPQAEEWELRVHGLMLALAVSGNVVGTFRHAIERMDPVHYLTSSYYEHWMAALETLRAETEASGVDAKPPIAPEVMDSLFGGRPTARIPATTRFTTGQRVRVTHRGAPGHTRCPRYIRGAEGTVTRIHSSQPLPDAYAVGEQRSEVQYSVAFRCADLFPDGEPRATVTVDLWESYLDVG